jgi:uncharacterized protein (DUF58 family)
MFRRLPPVHLTGRGWGLLFAGGFGLVIAYASGWPALLAVSLFAGAIVAGGALVVALAPTRVSVERRLAPDVAEPGRPVAVRLTVGGHVAAGADWIDGVPRTVQVNGAARGRLPRLGDALAAVEIEYTLVGRRRGIVTIGPLRLERTDPFGVAVAERPAGSTATLTVLPTVHELQPPSAAVRTDLDPDAVAVFGLSGEQRDILAREYRAGDPLRAVDWRSTAHRGELMVRAEAAASAVSTALVFDIRESVWADDHVFEWAVQCAASLVAAVSGRGSTVRLTTDAAEPLAPDMTSALLALATVALRPGGASPAELVRRVRGEHVHVLHVLTGVGAAADLETLPPLPPGAVGLLSVVGRPTAPLRVARGWRLTVRDPAGSVEEAWARG